MKNLTSILALTTGLVLAGCSSTRTIERNLANQPKNQNVVRYENVNPFEGNPTRREDITLAKKISPNDFDKNLKVKYPAIELENIEKSKEDFNFESIGQYHKEINLFGEGFGIERIINDNFSEESGFLKFQEDRVLLSYALDKIDEKNKKRNRMGYTCEEFKLVIGDERLKYSDDKEFSIFCKCNPLMKEFLFQAYNSKDEFYDFLPPNYKDKFNKFNLDKVNKNEIKYFEEMVPWSFKKEGGSFSEEDKRAIFFLMEVYPKLY